MTIIDIYTSLVVFIPIIISAINWIQRDKYGNWNPMFSVILKWYDGWVGFFWDKKKKWLYVFFIPFVGVIFKPYRKNFD